MMENSGSIKPKKGFHKIKLEYSFNQRYTDIKLIWNYNSFKEIKLGKKVLFVPPGLDVPK